MAIQPGVDAFVFTEMSTHSSCILVAFRGNMPQSLLAMHFIACADLLGMLHATPAMYLRESLQDMLLSANFTVVATLLRLKVFVSPCP